MKKSHLENSQKKTVRFANFEFIEPSEDGIEEFGPLKGDPKSKIYSDEEVLKEGLKFTKEEIETRIKYSETAQKKANDLGDLRSSSEILDEKIQEMEQKTTERKSAETNSNNSSPSKVLTPKTRRQLSSNILRGLGSN